MPPPPAPRCAQRRRPSASTCGGLSAWRRRRSPSAGDAAEDRNAPRWPWSARSSSLAIGAGVWFALQGRGGRRTAARVPATAPADARPPRLRHAAASRRCTRTRSRHVRPARRRRPRRGARRAAAPPKTDPGALVISAVGLVDPSEARYQSDQALMQSDLRADSRSQLVEKAIGLLVDPGSVAKNYDVLRDKLLSKSGDFVTHRGARERARRRARTAWCRSPPRPSST